MRNLGLIVLFSLALSATAQDKNPLDHPGCKAYFMPFWADSHIPGGLISHWEKSQEKWFLGKGQKKYPTVCMDAKKATYMLVYTTEEHAVRVTEIERFGGGSREMSGTVTDSEGNASRMSGTVDMPDVGIPVERTVQRTTVYMYVFSTGDKPFYLGAKPMSKPLEVFVEKQHERPLKYVVGEFAGLSNAARDALEDSIRFIASTTK